MHVPVICRAYPCHNFFLSSGIRPIMKFSLYLNCCSISAYPCTAFIKLEHDKICLPPVRLQAPLPAFRWVAVAGAAAQAAAAAGAASSGGNRGSLRRSLRDLGACTATKFEGSWRLHSTRSPARPRSTSTAGYARLGNNQDVCRCRRWDNQLCSLLRRTLDSEAPRLKKSRQEKIQA